MLSSRISTWSSDLSIGSSNHFLVTSNCSAKVIQTFLWILQLGRALKTENIYVSGTSGMYPFLKFAQSTISLQPSSTGTSLSLKTIGTSDFRWHYGNLNFFYWIFFLICSQESKVRTKYDYVIIIIMVQGLIWYTAQVVYQSSLKGQCREIFNTFLNKKTLPGKTVSQNCS